MSDKTYTLHHAQAEADRLALEAADDFHIYVFPAPDTPRRFIVVPEDEYDGRVHRGARYCQNGRGARLGQVA